MRTQWEQQLLESTQLNEMAMPTLGSIASNLAKIKKSRNDLIDDFKTEVEHEIDKIVKRINVRGTKDLKDQSKNAKVTKRNPPKFYVKEDNGVSTFSILTWLELSIDDFKFNYTLKYSVSCDGTTDFNVDNYAPGKVRKLQTKDWFDPGTEILEHFLETYQLWLDTK